MTEPSPPRPVPGPPRPGPGAGPAERSVPSGSEESRPGAEPDRIVEDPFADLRARPVAEHVAVFEAEHARLEGELGTIDRL
jgi:hypothetical protein